MGRGEHKAFQRAAEQFAARAGDAEPIAEMMRLACEGRSVVRRWAATWLSANCNITVVIEQELDHATPAPAEGFLR